MIKLRFDRDIRIVARVAAAFSVFSLSLALWEPLTGRPLHSLLVRDSSSAERKETLRAVSELRIAGQDPVMYIRNRSAVVWSVPKGQRILESPPTSTEKTSLTFNGLPIGSAAFISADGYLLTAAHVVKADSDFWVHHHSDGQSWGFAKARLVWKQTDHCDLAVLKIEKEKCTFFPIENAKQIRRGELVLSAGLLFGEDDPYSLVNPMDGAAGQFLDLDAASDQTSKFIARTTIPAIRGNSGGPLITEEGKLVAVLVRSPLVTRTGVRWLLWWRRQPPYSVVEGMSPQDLETILAKDRQARRD